MRTVILPQVKSHLSEWHDCTKCNIGTWAQRHVFFRGNVPADVMFIGEGPGRDEDAIGQPFVGKSGQVLDLWIESTFADNYKDLTWCITNLVCCRPSDSAKAGNRQPTKEEVSNCWPRLIDFIRLVKPIGVVFLGRVPEGYGPDLMGMIKHQLPLRHPSYILRQGSTPKGLLESQEQGQKLAEFLDKIRKVKHT